jgi:poly(3-hydroxybutyrate) depolymerase
MHRRLLRLALLLAALLIALPLLLIAAYRLANQTNGALVSGGETRRYLLYVPDSYDPATPRRWSSASTASSSGPRSSAS